MVTGPIPKKPNATKPNAKIGIAKANCAGSKLAIEECIEHPKTRESINGFQKDIDAWVE